MNKASVACSFVPYPELQTLCKSFFQLLDDVNSTACSGSSPSKSLPCEIVTDVETFVNGTIQSCDVIPNKIARSVCKLVTSETATILGDACDPQHRPKYVDPKSLTKTELGCSIAKTVSLSFADLQNLCDFIPNGVERASCSSVVTAVSYITSTVCSALEPSTSLTSDLVLNSSSKVACTIAEKIVHNVNSTVLCSVIPDKYPELATACDDLTLLIPEMVDNACDVSLVKENLQTGPSKMCSVLKTQTSALHYQLEQRCSVWIRHVVMCPTMKGLYTLANKIDHLLC